VPGSREPAPGGATLVGLTARLDRYARGSVSAAELARWLDRLLAADPLGSEATDPAPWDAAPDDARLFWRLVYLFDVEADAADDAAQRRLAHRVVRCVASAGGAAAALEILPVVVDQERFCAIVAKHLAGVISRTGFLSVLAESGYPEHVKLWLAHAAPAHLERLCARLAAGSYGVVARAFERPPR